MKKINQLLTKLDAHKEIQEWAKGKTFEEVYNTCHRGDWLNWLFARTNPEDVQLLTLVKGHQANTVRHLMKDARSMKAVDIAIAFGEGKATREELSEAARAAYHAARAEANAASYADCDAAVAACYAASAAVVTASYAASAAAASAVEAAAVAAYIAASRAADAAEAVEKENQKLTANIFRKYISIEKFNLINI